MKSTTHRPLGKMPFQFLFGHPRVKLALGKRRPALPVQPGQHADDAVLTPRQAATISRQQAHRFVDAQGFNLHIAHPTSGGLKHVGRHKERVSKTPRFSRAIDSDDRPTVPEAGGGSLGKLDNVSAIRIPGTASNLANRPSRESSGGGAGGSSLPRSIPSIVSGNARCGGGHGSGAGGGGAAAFRRAAAVCIFMSISFASEFVWPATPVAGIA